MECPEFRERWEVELYSNTLLDSLRFVCPCKEEVTITAMAATAYEASASRPFQRAAAARMVMVHERTEPEHLQELRGMLAELTAAAIVATGSDFGELGGFALPVSEVMDRLKALGSELMDLRASRKAVDQSRLSSPRGPRIYCQGEED